MRHLHRLFDATQVVAATFPAAGGEPDIVTAGADMDWSALPETIRRHVLDLAGGPDLLAPDVQTPGGAGIALQHPEGVLVIWIELGGQRQLTTEDQTLLTLLTSRLTQGIHRIHQTDQQRETALALQHAILGPASLPFGFQARYQPVTAAGNPPESGTAGRALHASRGRHGVSTPTA